MFVDLIFVCNFIRLCKQCYGYAVALISLLIIFLCYKNLFVINRELDLKLITVRKNESVSSLSMVYEYRLRSLNESCENFHPRAYDIHKRTGESLLRQHPLLQLVILLLQSHSLMYCAVPKVATKSLLTSMIYVHLRDINEHLNNNWSNINVTTARKEQHINIHAFINELRKV
jgi:hypothetical protein